MKENSKVDKIVLSKEAKEILQDFCYMKLCYECPFRKEDEFEESHFLCKLDFPYRWDD